MIYLDNFWFFFMFFFKKNFRLITSIVKMRANVSVCATEMDALASRCNRA